MESKPRKFLFKELEDFTDKFSVDNLIGKFQYGELYRGVINGRDVTVKKWIGLNNCYRPAEGEIEIKFRHEIRLLQESKMRYHPTMVELIGYCDEGEERFGTVLELNALDSLYNIVLKDELDWVQRIKVMMGVGFLFKVMHEKEGGKSLYLLRNFDPNHIILDKDYNPKLVDLNMVSVGEIPEKPTHHRQIWKGEMGCTCYLDMSVIEDDGWSEKVDVHSFGILIMFLIGKLKYVEELECQSIDKWANEEYVKPEKLKSGRRGYMSSRTSNNLVDKSIQKRQVGYYHCDGTALSELAISCLAYRQIKRPTMEHVVNVLKDLRVLQYFPHILNIHRLEVF